MPATSLKQLNFLRMVYDAKQRGLQLTGKAGKAENSMSASSLEDYVNTPQEGLPLTAKKKKRGL